MAGNYFPGYSSGICDGLSIWRVNGRKKTENVFFGCRVAPLFTFCISLHHNAEEDDPVKYRIDARRES
jgi:hypothetical protein